ncbi:amino acid ABC transporter permease [Pseudonocardia sp. HH130630-07]|uniref:amino acid ABC transporter permease n=1 Tax=Pseudonocardia sp. HH130630-07 TaxID=1690815 RepID=UPI000814B731|nr:amino acid ABC transporter permease [Pseudonocardia sp. HH130630-07]ANY08418.1 glutamate ABC transporter permease [Pseudonocardia sp. HH130630-07]
MDLFSKYDILGAFWTTIQLTLLSAVGALVWGTILAAMRVGPVPVMRGFATAYVNVIRNTPLTILVLFASLGLASSLGITLVDADSPTSLADSAFRLAVLAFIVYTATFVCEAVRSGINTVPVGQAEAARALGMGFLQVLVLIVLPQALRSTIGPLASVLIALTKNTTVAAVIGVGEAALLMSEMVENESDVLLLVFLVFAFGFIVLTLPTGLLLGRLARRLEVRR